MNVKQRLHLRFAAIFALGFVNGAALLAEPLALFGIVPVSAWAIWRLR